MKFIIKKGHHWPRWWWLRWPFYYNRTVIEREFLFAFSGIYQLPNGDQEDHNKLFGISYHLNDHRESARTGWRYDPAKNVFILSAYCYVKDQRIMIDICEIVANIRYKGRIIIYGDYYRFTVYRKEDMKQMGAPVSVPKWHTMKLGFKLGFYFGGNQTAPHDVTLEINNP